MTCQRCGTPLPPNTGFCGACGTPVAAPQQAQPPQQAYPPQTYPAQQQQPYPQQQHQPPQQQQPYPSHGQPHGAYAQPYPQPLIPHPLVLQRGPFTRLTGHMFLAPQRLFFICSSNKGGLGVALGAGVGGLIGGVIAAVAAPNPGEAPMVDEAALFHAAHQMPGSMIMEPGRFKAIKYTMWTRGIFYDGTTYALREGLTKELRYELGLWANANGVKNAGLK